VVSPLAVGPDARLLNVNADTVAMELACALGAAKLILVTGAPGILSRPDDPSSVVPFVDLVGLDALEQQGVLRGGMRPKVAAIRRALHGGVPRVHVVDGRDEHTLLREVFTTDGAGTLVVADGGAVEAEFVVA
jgi:acetylglutamate kinase